MLDQLVPWTEAMQTVRTKAAEASNN
jgi:hypothetical protein